MENRYKSQGDYFENFISQNISSSGEKFDRFLEHYGAASLGKIHKADSFDWLFRFLQEPADKIWRACAFVYGLMTLDAKGFSTPESVSKWIGKVNTTFPEKVAEGMEASGGDGLYGLFEVDDSESKPLLKMFSRTDKAAVNQGDADQMRLACCLFNNVENREDKAFEAFWNGYLRLYNLYQFLPGAMFTTSDDFESEIYGKGSSEKRKDRSEDLSQSDEEVWKELRDLADPVLGDFLDKLESKNVPLPEAGYELADETGEVVAEAELGWPELKVAILGAWQIVYSKAFEGAGWRVYRLDDVLDDPETVLSSFGL